MVWCWGQRRWLLVTTNSVVGWWDGVGWRRKRREELKSRGDSAAQSFKFLTARLGKLGHWGRRQRPLSCVLCVLCDGKSCDRPVLSFPMWVAPNHTEPGQPLLCHCPKQRTGNWQKLAAAVNSRHSGPSRNLLGLRCLDRGSEHAGTWEPQPPIYPLRCHRSAPTRNLEFCSSIRRHYESAAAPSISRSAAAVAVEIHLRPGMACA